MTHEALQKSRPLRGLAQFLGLSPRERIEVSNAPRRERVTIILPVLNEAARLSACLESLMAQPREAAEILVVDGGSTDETRKIIERGHGHDKRVRLVDASPVNPTWTGKAWGLYVGLEASSPDSEWILCVDADVRAAPQLLRSMLHHAARTGVSSFSVATAQRLPGPAAGLIHPALLTTLIYRFGRPGTATQNLHRVVANGQCFISRRATLLQTGALQAAQSSLCEDITIARRLAECGEAVGFYESRDLIEVRMYDDWRETWRNWPRSLPMRDQYFGWREWFGLFKVLLFQALPLPVLFLCAITARFPSMTVIAGVLVFVRVGILVGMARAYRPTPWSYWLSPLLDLPVALKLITSALARQHVWRGKTYVRRDGGRFEPAENQLSASREAPSR